jgi:acyl-coenzyme A synthetase/AMP-(fatty) acid ligase
MSVGIVHGTHNYDPQCSAVGPQSHEGAQKYDSHSLAHPIHGVMRSTHTTPARTRSDRPRQVYYTDFPGLYFTGDGARRDADGDYWITGRVDDVINVSGHRMGARCSRSVALLRSALRGWVVSV